MRSTSRFEHHNIVLTNLKLGETQKNHHYVLVQTIMELKNILGE